MKSSVSSWFHTLPFKQIVLYLTRWCHFNNIIQYIISEILYLDECKQTQWWWEIKEVMMCLVALTRNLGFLMDITWAPSLASCYDTSYTFHALSNNLLFVLPDRRNLWSIIWFISNCRRHIFITTGELSQLWSSVILVQYNDTTGPSSPGSY